MKKAMLIFLSCLLSLTLPITLISCGSNSEDDSSAFSSGDTSHTDTVSLGGGDSSQSADSSDDTSTGVSGDSSESEGENDISSGTDVSDDVSEDDNTSDDTSSGDTKPDDDVPSDPINVENGLAVYMPENGTLKIAQFADLHFGTEGNSYHNDKTERTIDYVRYIVETEKPDLIVCSGDNIMTTGVEALKVFVEMMDNLKTPWTFIYGNHDAESTSTGFSKKSLSDYLESCGSKYLLYDAGYVETGTNRYGNFSISVLNSTGTKLLGAVILLDSGTYNSSISNYDSLTKGQIEWYKKEIDKLNALYTGTDVMPSAVFAHIQIPEYYTAYKAALSGNGASFVIKQELSSADVEAIRTGGPTNVNTGMFEAMKEKESTVAFFCGHAHLYDFQVKMDGIVLGFGPQTGFSTLFENNDMPRHTYIYKFDKNFAFTTDVCVEDGSNLGLTYCGTFDDSATYNSSTKTYTFSHNFNVGNEIVLAYNGVRLSTSNTTFTGNFRVGSSATWKGGFYCPDGKTLIYDDVTSQTCNFVYNPSTKTLTIEVEEIEVDPDAIKSVSIDSVNSDAGADAIAIWTNSGTKIKEVTNASTGTGNWIGNGWRYYVVVDAEGRITYAVLWPLSGYGGPAGTSYYTHPVYASDYNTNPSIHVLDGFANDWAQGGIGYTLFEIVVPEGGFAFTSHGTANYSIVDMLSQGTVEDYNVGNINTRSLYNSNIRVSYDLSTMTIKVTTVD